jgi:opacity protein-like surface antigen
MNRLLLVLAMLLALPILTQAQELPRQEIFGGYSYMRLDAGNAGGDQDLNGFNTSYTYNFNSFLGMTAEFSGAFANNVAVTSTMGTMSTTTIQDINNYFVLFGPKFTFRGNERVTPFAHVLLGVVTQDFQTASNGTTMTSTTLQNNTQFAMAVGGGIDLNLTERLSVRGAQVDYVMTRLPGNGVATVGSMGTGMGMGTSLTSGSTVQNNLRASAGIVLKLGEQ